jgi:hypothetical protein
MLHLAPARMRRVAVCGVLLFLSVWSVWVSSTDEPVEAGVRLTLAVFALSAGLAALALWRATDVALTLTESALTDSRGRVLARLDQIERVERGALSMAPTGGFVLRLSTPGPVQWVPGVWWRIGTRVGVGGTTPRLMTREMALLIEAMLAMRGR